MTRRAEVPRLGLEDVGADAELDIVAPGTPLSEFYGLSTNAIRRAALAAGVLTSEQAVSLAERTTEPGSLVCGFVYVGAWGRRP